MIRVEYLNVTGLELREKVMIDDREGEIYMLEEGPGYRAMGVEFVEGDKEIYFSDDDFNQELCI